MLKKKINVFNLLKLTKNNFYIYGLFGSQFIHIPFLLFSSDIYYFNISFLRNNLNFFLTKLIGLKYGWRVRLKIVGRGLSFFKRNNFVYMNIGRSHIVRFYMKVSLRVLCLKKKMTLLATNFDYLRLISHMLITAQPPLLYKVKGLVYQFYNYKIKPGKIKQYRV
jgi:hypothetical protein